MRSQVESFGFGAWLRCEAGGAAATYFVEIHRCRRRLLPKWVVFRRPRVVNHGAITFCSRGVFRVACVWLPPCHVA